MSTSIRDVVRPYGEQGLSRIADTSPEFVRGLRARRWPRTPSTRITQADAFLRHTSWDGTGIRFALLHDTGVDADDERYVEVARIRRRV